MARNKYPERTVEKILHISLKLFSEKGYDKTTIQDIVDALGMSKGAIYHHFKSKEDIMYAICDSYYHKKNREMNIIFEDASLNGLQRLKAIIRGQIDCTNKMEMDELAMNMLRDPKMFMNNIQESLSKGANYARVFLEQGMEDGSLRKQDATAASQILLLLLNYWIYSPVTTGTKEDIIARVKYFRELCECIGMPIIDDELEAVSITYFLHLSQRQ